ncbi:hypothetical protein SDC9_95849 [bioreactor metagenome]|uniref:Uncharacterized protein n=1 Tax=bioreactor metagenome TaxID=1076179 RepID=A0A645AA01_9ZZZZ
MEFDEIRQKWARLEKRVEYLELQNKELMMKGLRNNYTDSLGKMKKYELFFFILSFVFAILYTFFAIFVESPVLNIETSVLFIVVFYLAGAWQGYKLYLIRQLDFSTDSVIDLALKVTRYKLLTKIRLVVGMFLIVPFFVLFFYFQRDIIETPMIISSLIGGLIGLVVGIKAELAHLKNINTLIVSIDELRKIIKG